MTSDAKSAETALITGGARRIGRAIALALAASGYAVVLHVRREDDAADALVRTIAEQGGRPNIVTGDLSDAAAVEKIVPAAAAFGPLTLLVNNAAGFDEDAFGDLDRARFERTLAVNLMAPVFLAQAFAAQAPDGSAIVNILDQRVFKPTPRFFSYSLSKAALHAATVTMAQALAPRLRVNAVAPGPTLPSPRQSEADFAKQAESLPLARGPSPEEIAAAVVYLARATSVTGVTIPVDGGQHLAWRTPDSDLAE
jgi:NAD(P)-dependent dehydrogenase (short-subunit alcohol dehydrogenase family)